MDEQGTEFNAPSLQLPWMLIWGYPLVSFLLMGVNIFFIVHALKTGRPYYWIWIIFMMPVVGAAAYFFVEMKPKLPKLDWQSIRWALSSPQYRIQQLQLISDRSPTVKNRERLAREYERQDLWTEATEQYQQCLSGVFKDDPRLKILLASTLIESNDLVNARKIVEEVPEQRDRQYEENRRIALLRCQAAQGEPESAIEGLQELTRKTSSLRPRYYLAEAFSQADQQEASNRELQSILQDYRQGNALFRKSEQAWYLKAKRMLQGRR